MANKLHSTLVLSHSALAKEVSDVGAQIAKYEYIYGYWWKESSKDTAVGRNNFLTLKRVSNKLQSLKQQKANKIKALTQLKIMISYAARNS